MEPKREAEVSRGTAALGTVEITLLADSRGGTYRTATQLRDAAPTLAREITTSLAALLFTERQMRATSDPMRLAAVDQLANAVRASREDRLTAGPATATRTVASYQVKLIAGQTFRVDVESKTDGMLQDAAGSEVVGALTNELLASLADPYRTFYREMLEAAINYWHERRPSLMESTWDWPVALRRLDQLTRSGTAIVGDPQVCESCGAIRPSGHACLRCGATPASPRLDDLIASVSSTSTASIGAANPFPESATASSAPASQPSSVATQTSAPTSPTPSILPANDLALEIAAAEPPAPVLAGPGRRAIALLVDIVSGLLLGAIAGFGLTNILISNSAFGPGDSPRSATISMAILVLGIYLVLGWTKSETLGMALFKLRLVKAADQNAAGAGRALLRAVGYLGLFLLAFAVFYLLNEVDNQLVFIQGTADLIVRIIIGVISLYVLWMGSGQLILGGARRQNWGDRLAGTIVTLKKA